jgi:transcriptional regulator with XRE-family HTH domain
LDKPWEEIGRKIRKRRRLAGFKTQDDLARALGCDRTRVSRWESGEESPRKFRDQLMSALGVGPDFFEEETPPSVVRDGAPESAKLAILRLVLDMSDADARGLLATLESDVPDLGSDEIETPATRRR